MIREFKLKIDWLFWFILIGPTFYIYGHDLRNTQAEFFRFSAVALLGVMHVNKWIGGLLLYVLAYTLFVQADANYMTNLFFGAMIYQTIVVFCEKHELRKYAWAFTGLLVLNLLWCIRQRFQADPIFSMMDYEYQTLFTDYPGFFGLPAFLGNFAAAAMPMGLIISPWTFPLFLTAVWISKSTFSMLAAWTGGLFYLWFRKRILFWGALVISTLAIGFYALKVDMPTGEFYRRIVVWKMVERVAYAKQFFGYGPGAYPKFFTVEAEPSHRVIMTTDIEYFKKFLVQEAAAENRPELASKLEETPIEKFKDGEYIRSMFLGSKMDIKHWAHTHNEFLQVFFDLGMFGLVFIFGYTGSMFRRFYRWGRKSENAIALMACFCAILVVSFGHFPFQIARLAGPFIVLMALCDFYLKRLELE